MKALEVLLNGQVIGLYVPPEGECFSAMVANVPRTYMRAQVLTGNEKENWQWQLPDIKEGDTIAFRLVEANGRAGIPPQRVTPKDLAQVKRIKKEAAKARAKTGSNKKEKTKRKK